MFVSILSQLPVYQELDQEISNLVAAVRSARKSGRLSLTLIVHPTADEAITFAADVKSKLPERKKANTKFFLDASGQLVKNDPRQQSLALCDTK